MLSQSIRRWNPWWASGSLDTNQTGIVREKLADVKGSLGTPQIKSVIGPRRTGKTTLLYQVIGDMLSNGVSPKSILMLNFDDNNIYNTDFEALVSECKAINPGITHLFLDEVQERKDWERWVRTLYDTKQFEQIFVTGSSSSLMSQDVSRVLTGRHTTFHAYPFSFREYLAFSGWNNLNPDYVELHKGELLHHLHAYLKYGGFPEAVKMDELNRNRYLNNLFDDVVSRDISGRRGTDYHIARKIAYYAMSNSAKQMSPKSVAVACGVAWETAERCMEYMRESHLLFQMRQFSFKLKEQMREANKYYAVDTGLADAVSFKFAEDAGRRAETAIFLELSRRHSDNPKMEMYFWRDKTTKKEVDFIVKDSERVHEAIQSCWNPSDNTTKKREVSALIKAMDEFELAEGYIITENYEGEETVQGSKGGNKKIRFVTMGGWLIQKGE